MKSSSAFTGVMKGLTLRIQIRHVLGAGLGSFLALALIGLLAAHTQQIWILGSFGATCVLLFGFPASPFSHPRNVIFGHLLASTIGLVFLSILGPGWWSMALAGGCTVMLMMLTQTVHPPAGSNPVIVYLTQPGWGFLLYPTLCGALMLVGFSWLFWRIVHRRVPAQT